MEKKHYKIVYVTPALYMAGGVERVLTLKANYFADFFDYDITVVITEGKGKPVFYPLSKKIKVINLDVNFEELWHCSFSRKVWLYLYKQHLFKRKLTTELMQIRPDITISLLRREINFINEIKDGSKKIGEIHINRANYRNFDEHESNFLKRQFAKIWSRNLVGHLRKLDHFVVLTEKDREAWVELDNVSVIPDPLPFIPVSVSRLTEKRVVAVARYSYEKGIDLLLRAWADFEHLNKEWRLDVYGDGDRSVYEQMIDDLKINRDRCCLNGRTTNVEEIYCNSSVFVLTSRFEGFGMVIIEAMACGLPVVAFDCPWGPRSIIKDGEDGILVKNGDVRTLAQRLSYLTSDHILLNVMAQKAVENVKRFYIDKIASEWNLLFQGLEDKRC